MFYPPNVHAETAQRMRLKRALSFILMQSYALVWVISTKRLTGDRTR